MFTDKELINLPTLKVGIPVGHNQAACLTHLLVNQLGDIRITLEDLREEGATLTLSCHTRAYPEWMKEDDTQTTEQIKQYWEDYMEEQKARYGMNKPMTMKQLDIHNDLAEKGIIKYAGPKCWSEEKKSYCEQFENGLFDSIDVWEGEEDD